jgi:hypothetical protein
LNNGLYYTHYQLQKVKGNTTEDDYVKEKEKAKNGRRITRRLNKEGIKGDFEFEYPKDFIGLHVSTKKDGVWVNGKVLRYKEPYYWVEWDDKKGGEEIAKKQVEMYHDKWKLWKDS